MASKATLGTTASVQAGRRVQPAPLRQPCAGTRLRHQRKDQAAGNRLGQSGPGQAPRAWCRFLGCLFRLLPQLFLPFDSRDQPRHVAPAAATTGCWRVLRQDTDASHCNLELICNLAMSFGDFPLLTHSAIARASELQHRSSLCMNAGLCPCSGRRWFIG